MRVIGGTSRGRPLRAPTSTATRPTSDRVREAIFDILGSLVPIAGSSVVDLFSGSGALGIEALSRGASSAVLVEQNPRAVSVIRANLDACGLIGAEVVRADCLAWLARIAPGTRFDVALADPPYRFDRWATLLGHLPADVAIVESQREPVLPESWRVLKQRRYGGTLVTVLRSRAPAEGGRGSAAGENADRQEGSP